MFYRDDLYSTSDAATQDEPGVSHRLPRARMSFLTIRRLLSKRDMQELFPGAEIIEEKLWGVTKSLIAVSVPPQQNYTHEHS